MARSRSRFKGACPRGLKGFKEGFKGLEGFKGKKGGLQGGRLEGEELEGWLRA